MEWTDEGIILGVRRHGESSAIVELLTRGHGRHLGLVRGGASKRMRPMLQPGNSVTAIWRARLDEHLAALLSPALNRERVKAEAPAKPAKGRKRAENGFAEAPQSGYAIGDAAVTAALDAVEAARVANGLTAGRHHIAHLQLVRPADLGRFVQLGVTVNMQALWACNDDSMVSLVREAIGEQRYQWHYPFGSLARSGAALAMGSDWAVSTPDPWAAISVAVNRAPDATS